MKNREYRPARLSAGQVRMIELLADLAVDRWMQEQQRRPQPHESSDLRSLQLGQAKRDLP